MKRANKQILIMRKKKADVQMKLYAWMVKHNLDEYGGYKTSKLAPKKKSRKNAKDKKQDALRLFSDIGVDDPETLWMEFQKTQKPLPPDEENYEGVPERRKSNGKEEE
jgi:hypothetical protein